MDFFIALVWGWKINEKMTSPLILHLNNGKRFKKNFILLVLNTIKRQMTGKTVFIKAVPSEKNEKLRQKIIPAALKETSQENLNIKKPGMFFRVFVVDRHKVLFLDNSEHGFRTCNFYLHQICS